MSPSTEHHLGKFFFSFVFQYEEKPAVPTYGYDQGPIQTYSFPSQPNPNPRGSNVVWTPHRITA